MLVGIHVHRRGEIGPFSKKYIRILEHNKIPWIKIDVNDLDFLEKLKSCSHFIFHWGGFPDHHQIARTIMPVIEKELQIPVFPDYKTTWHHDDKIRQFFLLKAYAFPIIDSWVFWEKPKALEWLKGKAKYPLVFKLKSSAGSQDILLVKDYLLARHITDRLFGKGIFPGHVPGNFILKIKDFKWGNFFNKILKKTYRFFKGRDINLQWLREKNYVLFQKFLPENKYDTRITIIGNRAFAFRRFNRKNDFRSSGSGKINYEKDKIAPVFIRLAFEISLKLGFQSMAYDFLWDENHKPAICEISYTYQDLALYNCSGYWDTDLNWHEGNNWPQFYHLVDLLQMPGLKQADFDAKED
jgi:glutathione synthase/RimK-type ligase-like ATP-grasp enzyme